MASETQGSNYSGVIAKGKSRNVLGNTYESIGCTTNHAVFNINANFLAQDDTHIPAATPLSGEQLMRLEASLAKASLQSQATLIGPSSSFSQCAEAVMLMQRHSVETSPQHGDPTIPIHDGNHKPHTAHSVVGASAGPVCVNIQPNVQYKSQCRSWCGCKCHKRQKWSNPTWLNSLIGKIYIGYPLGGDLCDEKECRGGRPGSVVASWQIPLWFMSKMIFATMSSNPIGMSITIPNVVISSAPIFGLARDGDVEGMKKAFREKSASAHDISSFGGYSVLQYAVRYSRIDAIKFLIDEKADPLHENEWQESAIDEAWNYIFRRPRSETTLLQKIFYEQEPLEKRQFSILHRIILDLTLVPRSLKLELQESTSQVNHRDSQGKTALFWAAQRGNLDALVELLQAGADPNLHDNAGLTPLHGAASAPHEVTACVKVLLDAGADAKFKNKRGFTPLHFTCHHQDNHEVVRLMIKAGADVESRDAYGQSPLGIAARQDHAKCTKVLLDNGANVEAADNLGYTPLLATVYRSALSSMRLLLQAMADTSAILKNSQTILHITAIAASLSQEMLVVLASAIRLDVDTEAKDSEGRTAKELFVGRKMGAAIEQAFERLLGKIIPL